MNSKWRPAMGWSYMLTCITDFVVFPILWSILQSISKGQVTIQWQPITLQGAGLYHIAMGAVLGIAAYGRTQEKMNGVNNGGIQLPANAGTTYIPPSNVSGQKVSYNYGNTDSAYGQSTWTNQPVSMGGSPVGGGAFANERSFGAAPVMTGFKGKPAPMQPDYPEI